MQHAASQRDSKIESTCSIPIPNIEHQQKISFKSKVVTPYKNPPSINTMTPYKSSNYVKFKVTN